MRNSLVIHDPRSCMDHNQHYIIVDMLLSYHFEFDVMNLFADTKWTRVKTCPSSPAGPLRCCRYVYCLLLFLFLFIKPGGVSPRLVAVEACLSDSRY